MFGNELSVLFFGKFLISYAEVKFIFLNQKAPHSCYSFNQRMTKIQKLC
ncbi:hypothetical protein QE390_003406 [Siphonobacter sp. SORGH_AS 1065]|nr:hypothetical protein [Siphonobacter sp. SORGH_AS_1065]